MAVVGLVHDERLGVDLLFGVARLLDAETLGGERIGRCARRTRDLGTVLHLNGETRRTHELDVFRFAHDWLFPAFERSDDLRHIACRAHVERLAQIDDARRRGHVSGKWRARDVRSALAGKPAGKSLKVPKR